jgi:peptidoglycan/LPS O-acetylase OafA/YrhL
LTALIAFVATLLVASASHFWMERPLLNLKDRFFSLKRVEEQKAAVVMATE